MIQGIIKVTVGNADEPSGERSLAVHADKDAFMMLQSSFGPEVALAVQGILTQPVRLRMATFNLLVDEDIIAVAIEIY